MADARVLFVCTGNICRSPMAEYLLRGRLAPGSSWVVGSAGTLAVPGLPASEEAVRALDEKGIDLRPHRSRALTTELIVQSALVVVMTAAQDVQVRCLAPRDAEKVFLLTAFNPAARAGADIEDPIGLPLSAYRAVRDEIEGALPGLTAFMEAIRNRGCENSDRQ